MPDAGPSVSYTSFHSVPRAALILALSPGFPGEEAEPTSGVEAGTRHAHSPVSRGGSPADEKEDAGGEVPDVAPTPSLGDKSHPQGSGCSWVSGPMKLDLQTSDGRLCVAG